MISEGVKDRSRIDSETVRNIMIVNGGGSVALIALLPNVLYTPLVSAVLITLSIWLMGLTMILVHGIFRRKCSLIHEQNGMAPSGGRSVLGIKPGKPWVCWWAKITLHASIISFLLGGALMVTLSFLNIEELSHPPQNVLNQSDVAQ